MAKFIFTCILTFTSLVMCCQNSAKDFLKYAVECTEKEDYIGAIALCNRSIMLDPNYDLAWYHRAYNKFLVGDVDGTIADATKAIEFNGNLADAYILRAEAMLRKGERYKAVVDYNKARRIDGTGTLVHFASLVIKAMVGS